MLKCIEDIENAREQLGFAVNDFLRRKGWQYTCETPGSLWLWKRALKDGRVMLVNEATALYAQAWFDNCGES